MSSLHVSISGETIASISGFNITNSMATGTVVSILLVLFLLYFSTTKKEIKKIGRLQSLIELVVEGIYNMSRDVAGEKKARIFFPFIASSMFFILFNNWVSVLPGVGSIGVRMQESHASIIEKEIWVKSANASEEVLVDDHSAQTLSEPNQSAEENQEEVHAAEKSPEEEDGHSESKEGTLVPIIRPATADLNTTLALALISVAITQYYGVKYLGMGYFTKFINLKQGPIFTFVGLLELISEFAKIVSFAFRLFGNIFAGEVLLSVILFLLPAFAPIPFMGLEIFVGAIQALVFAMLTLVFINMATISHDH